MKKKTHFIVLLCLFIFTTVFAQEKVYTIATVPDPKQIDGGYISDPSNYLSVSEKIAINKSIKEAEQKTTAQIAVVLLPSIGKEVPKSFAVALFEKWKIGQADKDNGLLILTVMDQRRTEFETSYGLEGALPDITLFRIGTNQIAPHFKNKEFGKGLLAALNRIKIIIEDEEIIKEIYSNKENVHKSNTTAKKFPFTKGPLFFILIGYFILCTVLGIIYTVFIDRIHQNKEDFYNKFLAVRKLNSLFLLILFPIPFIFLRRLFYQRMKLYRYHPRFSKINGKELFIKNENEDDSYLYKGELKEEEIDAIDYDVWCTENDDDILILPYKNNNTPYTGCPECEYQTYKLTHTKTIRHATYNATGLKKREYRCMNCYYSDIKEVIIPKKVRETSSGSFSSGGSSGGGSSWGGGSSGGGGAGVSW